LLVAYVDALFSFFMAIVLLARVTSQKFCIFNNQQLKLTSQFNLPTQCNTLILWVLIYIGVTESIHEIVTSVILANTVRTCPAWRTVKYNHELEILWLYQSIGLPLHPTFHVSVFLLTIGMTTIHAQHLDRWKICPWVGLASQKWCQHHACIHSCKDKTMAPPDTYPASTIGSSYSKKTSPSIQKITSVQTVYKRVVLHF